MALQSRRLEYDADRAARVRARAAAAWESARVVAAARVAAARVMAGTVAVRKEAARGTGAAPGATERAMAAEGEMIQ